MINKLQEMFEKAYHGVMNQPGIAFDMENTACSYYTSEGNKCAVGHLIPDDVLKSVTIPAHGVGDMVNMFPAGWSALCYNNDMSHEDARQNIVFFVEMQQAHDGSIISVCNVSGGNYSTTFDIKSEALSKVNAVDEFKTEFKRRMKKLADKYRLVFPGE